MQVTLSLMSFVFFFAFFPSHRYYKNTQKHRRSLPDFALCLFAAGVYVAPLNLPHTCQKSTTKEVMWYNLVFRLRLVPQYPGSYVAVRIQAFGRMYVKMSD